MQVSLALSLQTECQRPPEPLFLQAGTVALWPSSQLPFLPGALTTLSPLALGPPGRVSSSLWSSWIQAQLSLRPDQAACIGGLA